MEHAPVSPADSINRHAEQQQQDSGSQHTASPEPKPRTVHGAATDKADEAVNLREGMQTVHEHKQSKEVKTRVKRLDKGTKAYIDGMLRRAQHRTWCQAHGKTLPPPKLSPVILRVIREWFDLVDDDGSGTLEHHELLAALQAARIPCDTHNIDEMIRLMDANRDGCIGWNEFEAFMMDEFAAGKHLLSGEYVLPSGMALPFGVMIRQLKRTQMLSEVTQGGEARRKWLHYNIDLAADAAAVAEAEETIRLQKIYNETLHNREVIVEPDGPGSDQAGSDDGAAADLAAAAAAAPGQPDRSGSGSDHVCRGSAREEYGCGSSSSGGSKYPGVRVPSWVGDPTSATAAAAAAHQQVTVAVIAGIPVITPRAETRADAAAAMGHLAGAGGAAASAQLAAAAAVPGGSGTNGSGSPRIAAKRAAVPRLQLGSLSGDGSSSSGSQQQQQHQQQHHSSIEPGSVLASARSSYWLRSDPATAAASGSSSSGVRHDKLADHLFQQSAAAAAATAAAGIPLDRLGSPRATHRTARLGSPAAAAAAASLSGGLSSRPGTSRLDQCPSPRQQQQQQQRQGSATLHHVIQPCKDEWSVVTASWLAKSHREKCEAETHCSVGATSPRAKSPRVQSPRIRVQSPRAQCSPRFTTALKSPVRAGYNDGFNTLNPGPFPGAWGLACSSSVNPLINRSQQQQQQQQQHGQMSMAGTKAAALAAAAQQSDGNYRDAGVKHLQSLKPVPPAQLLSDSYIGPVTAAVTAAHTPRSHYISNLSSQSGSGHLYRTATVAGGESGRTTPRQHHSSSGSSTSNYLDSVAGKAAAAAAAGGILGGAGVATVPCTVGKVLVATNKGGAVMNPSGQVVGYVKSPRQGPDAAAAAAGGGVLMGRGPAKTCVGVGLKAQLEASNSNSHSNSASGTDRLESSHGQLDHASSSSDHGTTPRAAAAAAGRAGKRGMPAPVHPTSSSGGSNNAPHSPRHSLLAQQLVKPHLVYKPQGSGKSQHAVQQQGSGDGAPSPQGIRFAGSSLEGVSESASARGSPSPRGSRVIWGSSDEG